MRPHPSTVPRRNEGRSQIALSDIANIGTEELSVRRISEELALNYIESFQPFGTGHHRTNSEHYCRNC